MDDIYKKKIVKRLMDQIKNDSYGSQVLRVNLQWVIMVKTFLMTNFQTISTWSLFLTFEIEKSNGQLFINRSINTEDFKYNIILWIISLNKWEQSCKSSNSHATVHRSRVTLAKKKRVHRILVAATTWNQGSIGKWVQIVPASDKLVYFKTWIIS